ncbi:MAG: single-stranded DNA-binding protein [Saprospiraceae bacterium]
MAINNTIELTGNMGAEPRFITTEGSNFASFTLYTTDSYKDEESGEWKNKESLYHNIIVFNPTIIEVLKGLNTKARLKVIGSISYREFKIIGDDGNEFTKREASIVAKKIEQAPLVKKNTD